MSKMQYMVSETYVKDWRVQHALREIIANGIDAENLQNAPLSVQHNPRTNVLSVKNERTKLDVSALYFGGSSKHGDTRAIGQYGEGLKLALLVLARNNIPVKVYNDDEVWRATIEPDVNGIRVLTLHKRKAQVPTGSVEVEVGNVSFDIWCDVRDMFLRLTPAKKKVRTDYGSVLFDPEHIGKYYARGVYVSSQPSAGFGYDFDHLTVGRDRVSFNSYEAESAIASIWGIAITHGTEFVRLFYDALMSTAQDLQGFNYMGRSDVSTNLVAYFRESHGDDAYPVMTTAESDMVAHYGLRGVILPKTLVNTLRRTLPTLEDLQRKKGETITRRYSIHELSAGEAAIFRDALNTIENAGTPLRNRVSIVDFDDKALQGLWADSDLLISRRMLNNWGELVVTILHELAHDEGADGTAEHREAEESLLVRVLNRLRAGEALQEPAPKS